MAHPLMPKATAVWLVENSSLTFKQIAEFCGLHDLEVQAIADEEVATGMQGLDPIAGRELTQEELDRCLADPKAKLELAKPKTPMPKARRKGARYTPVSKRQDRPDAIAWLVKNHPELTDAQISKLIGTTRNTIGAIRERSHWNIQNIQPKDPVTLGLCSQRELDAVVAKAAKNLPVDDEAAPAPSGGTGSDREKLIEELRAERDANEKAAAEAAQEAEAAAWLEAKRAAEETGETGEPTDV